MLARPNSVPIKPTKASVAQRSRLSHPNGLTRGTNSRLDPLSGATRFDHHSFERGQTHEAGLGPGRLRNKFSLCVVNRRFAATLRLRVERRKLGRFNDRAVGRRLASRVANYYV